MKSVDAIPPRHGADLAAASRRYGIALSDWLDVSTGINPAAYPFRAVDSAAFQHLPTDIEALCGVAQRYARSPSMPVAAAGSQSLIQWLPLVRSQMTGAVGRVAVPAIGYSEHAFRWQWAGHEVVFYDPRRLETIDALIDAGAVDVLVVINAHNPLGVIIEPAQLLQWCELLAQRDGWLIVDEAFIDPTPAHSVVAHADEDGLIVLRSLGKFFGLAGVRCGFAFCADAVREHLEVAVGPWALSGPTLAIATQALRDEVWQQNMRANLPVISAQNAALLQAVFAGEVLRHALFNSIVLPMDRAVDIEDRLAQGAVRVRRIELDETTHLLRFGLVDPAHESQWLRYCAALEAI